MRSESLRLVFGCFCIVNSCPSNAFRLYWICCGDGTGISWGSLLLHEESGDLDSRLRLDLLS